MNTTNNSIPGTPRRRKPNRALIAVIAVAVAAGGWYGVNKYLKRGDKEGEYLYAAVTTGDIEDLVSATGTLEPRDYVDVGAQVSGQIDKIYVEVGDVVKAGDPLVDIDATTSEARVEANRASLRSAETSLETQKNNLKKAERDYQRQLNLIKEDATTQEAVLNAETALISAQNQIKSSESQIAQQKANMRVEENNLKYTRITAPIAGTIMTVDVKEGATINATQQSPKVLRIANLGTMTVRSEVSEADVDKVYKGIPVYFTTLGQSRRWTGEVKRVEPTPKVQNSVVLYNALFDVENDSERLKPSMTAQVYFVNAEARNVLMVPMAALQQGQQISRALAEKAREKGKDAPGAANPAAPGAGPGAGAAGAPAAAGSATATANAATPPAPAGAPAVPGESARPAREPGAGGAAGGQRPGGPGGFNMDNLSPEQQEQFRRMREQRQANGGQGGGFGQRGAGGGGFGQRGAGGAGGFGGMGMGGGAAAGASRTPQQRRGTVMVKLADGKLEARQVVIGVTNRVHGQVLSGLKEGEEVVVGKREAVAAPGSAAPSASQPNQNQNRPNQGFPGGGFQGGGRPF